MNAHDPYLPLAAGTYFTCTGKTSWAAHDAGQVKALLEGDTPPEFKTVLGVVGATDFDAMTVAEQRAARHTGPMYFDLDGSTLDEAITDFRGLLDKLQALGLGLDTCRLFLTGGRGFHIEIPPECFTVSGLPLEGVTSLPRTYLEIAYALYVGCVDLRVYSGKRGRMWRVPNRRRNNSAFKVAISASEALSMTPQMYADLCSAPRAFPPLAAPTFCADLADLYRTARDKVNRPKKPRKQPEKLAAELDRRFKARGLPLPPSLLLLLDGKLSARDGEGWNTICVQIAICARAMGMGEDMLIKLAAPLLDGHRGDSGRYATRGQRERELRNKLAYFDGDGLYDFSAAGIKSILPKGLPCNDLEGL
jgi:hypothetical protein